MKKKLKNYDGNIWSTSTLTRQTNAFVVTTNIKMMPHAIPLSGNVFYKGYLKCN